MSRRLIIVNTYYQLIVAIQMKCTIFCDDEVVLLLSNHSNNAEEVYKRIKAIGIFDESYFIQSKGFLDEITIKNHIQDLYDFSFKVKNRFSFYLKDVNNLYFDEILTYNFARDIIGLFSTLYEFNNNLLLSIFEEGILSYNFSFDEGISFKMIKALRWLLGKKNAVNTIKYFYCFYHDFYKGNLITAIIPSVKKDSKCVSAIKEIFEFNMNENYKQKFIYFTSVYDFEGGEPIGEFKIVKKVQEIVGKDNLLIKVHPRDCRDVYNKSFFNVDSNSDVPWEVIQLSMDFSEKVFLTTTSGSVLAGSLLVDKPVQIYYLYKLCSFEKNTNAYKSVQTIKKLINDDKMCELFKNVRVIESLEELSYENSR